MKFWGIISYFLLIGNPRDHGNQLMTFWALEFFPAEHAHPFYLLSEDPLEKSSFLSRIDCKRAFSESEREGVELLWLVRFLTGFAEN